MYLRNCVSEYWDRLRYLEPGKYTRYGDLDPTCRIPRDFSTDLRTFSGYWRIYICPTVALLLDDSAQVYNELADKNPNRS